MLKSQEVRRLAPEMDPLRIGMGWKAEDLDKPQIMVESTFGDSHPGSAHLNLFVEQAVQGISENGGKASRYFATDMCDGIAQGQRHRRQYRHPARQPGTRGLRHQAYRLHKGAYME